MVSRKLLSVQEMVVFEGRVFVSGQVSVILSALHEYVPKYELSIAPQDMVLLVPMGSLKVKEIDERETGTLIAPFEGFELLSAGNVKSTGVALTTAEGAPSPAELTEVIT